MSEQKYLSPKLLNKFQSCAHANVMADKRLPSPCNLISFELRGESTYTSRIKFDLQVEVRPSWSNWVGSVTFNLSGVDWNSVFTPLRVSTQTPSNFITNIHTSNFDAPCFFSQFNFPTNRSKNETSLKILSS